MFEAASTQVYDDTEFVNVRANSGNRLNELMQVETCFRTSLIPNMRARESSTITYLAEDVSKVNTSWTVPLPLDWCINKTHSGWR